MCRFFIKLLESLDLAEICINIQTMKKQQIILISGMPSSGKLTMARRLAADMDNALLIDNHYMHDFVRPFIEGQFEADNISEYFNLIIKTWNLFFEFIEKFHIKSKKVRYVFTNSLWDNSEDLKVFEQFVQLATKMDADLIPITLVANPEVLANRCNTDARAARGKLADGDALRKLLVGNRPLDIKHPNAIVIDVSDVDESETFKKIINHLQTI